MHRSKRHYSITSARANSDQGMSRPSALAVLRMITSSYLVSACTGKSAAALGFPFIGGRAERPMGGAPDRAF